tara:strand:- start:172 stop:366 length:195 start_codon:yes stop_codon:yes gene_type:complete
MEIGDLIKIKRDSQTAHKGSIGLITNMHRVRYDKVHFLCTICLCDDGRQIRLVDEDLEVISESW